MQQRQQQRRQRRRRGGWSCGEETNGEDESRQNAWESRVEPNRWKTMAVRGGRKKKRTERHEAGSREMETARKMLRRVA